MRSTTAVRDAVLWGIVWVAALAAALAGCGSSASLSGGGHTHAAARSGSLSVGRADIGFDSGVEMSRPSSMAPIRFDAPS